MRGEKSEMTKEHISVQEIFCKGISWSWAEFITTGNGIGALASACGRSVNDCFYFLSEIGSKAISRMRVRIGEELLAFEEGGEGMK